MSSKCTIHLSNLNEHVYFDCSDEAIHIEIDKTNFIEFIDFNGEDCCEIVIKKDSSLAKLILGNPE